MGFHYTDTLEKHNWVGGGAYAYVYHVSPTIVVKTVRPDRSPEEEMEEHPLLKDIAFYKRLNERQDRCPNIVDCFVMLPDHLFLSYCANNAIIWRFHERQEREGDHILGRLIRVKDYEDPALIARWIQQLTSALEYVEEMGFCHNDLNTTNCLLDGNFNLKLTDFGRATTIGQFLEYTSAPWAIRLTAGPLKGTYGLCSARTEQFAVGSILYFMVYGHKPYEDINLDGRELEHRFAEMKFPELNRHKIFDGLIFGCWYNVYPTMALVAYDFKRKTKDIASITEYETIDRTKEEKTCEALIQKGILGPELALRFQPLWRKYLHAASKNPVLALALIDNPLEPNFAYSDRY
ncbi:protein kinase [Histoplasma capsulatum G186AR]|uniref:non-specific serine/threonine protein kinase n=1 Tax=Ajellomyces capsulatus (strain G186AR / H82 / ATCC MYA-2454 / RMSCC 2432) TaxID=447093 RepID=C0NSX3_AJECG|nr:protein kinase [Histoplasma capsulatum G186AR]EEH05134.1 protein kinase [Histoplasma capsulatum G186AR]